MPYYNAWTEPIPNKRFKQGIVPCYTQKLFGIVRHFEQHFIDLNFILTNSMRKLYWYICALYNADVRIVFYFSYGRAKCVREFQRYFLSFQWKWCLHKPYDLFYQIVPLVYTFSKTVTKPIENVMDVTFYLDDSVDICIPHGQGWKAWYRIL